MFAIVTVIPESAAGGYPGSTTIIRRAGGMARVTGGGR